MDIHDIKKIFKEDIKSLDADTIYVKYFGKNGEINKLIRDAKDKTGDEKIDFLKSINKIKKTLLDEFDSLKNNKLKEKGEIDIDLTVPVLPTLTGNLHPITHVSRLLNQFFHYYGFSVYDGPEIEDDYHNFEMLGVSIDHPARELQDTLYILQPEKLLRTQTSSIEARELEVQEPPIRFVFPGKAYRNETANKSNAAVFDQYQGVCVDKDITMGHLKWIVEKSIKFILGAETEIRFRPKYYPEVEPGMGVDVLCSFCKGEGCEICKYRGWMEIAGSGMIHPITLEKAGIDNKIYSGFAFGWGLDRIVMSRYGIKDIRSLFNGTLVYE